MRSLIDWHHEGAMTIYAQPSRYETDAQRLQRESYPEVCKAFAYYAENSVHGLDLLTKRICNGHDSIPIVERESLIKVFLMINPQRALPVCGVNGQ